MGSPMTLGTCSMAGLLQIIVGAVFCTWGQCQGEQDRVENSASSLVAEPRSVAWDCVYVEGRASYFNSHKGTLRARAARPSGKVGLIYTPPSSM